MASLIDNFNQNLFLGFAGLVTAVAVYSIWGQDSMFPAETEPKTQPEEWTREQLGRWLKSRKLEVTPKESRENLLVRVQDIKNRMVKPAA
ncbi:hypothetical protein MBLNU230_g8655t1 [Neophaeotheca triangularis]